MIRIAMFATNSENVSSTPISSAVGWLESALLGTVATTVAVIAVASVGFLMLTGRIEVRRAVQAVLGCFIIFGASTIANGVVGTIDGSESGAELAEDATPPPPALPQPRSYPSTSTSPFDPYAGAALSPRQ